MATDDNPALIYEGPDAPVYGSGPTPLFLVHDGGGTTFSYYCLEPLNRKVYGIHNPHYDQGGWWEGGIAEMAQHYVNLVSKTLPRGGDILLGGALRFHTLHRAGVEANASTQDGP
jgi:hypothetical protein